MYPSNLSKTQAFPLMMMVSSYPPKCSLGFSLIPILPYNAVTRKTRKGSNSLSHEIYCVGTSFYEKMAKHEHFLVGFHVKTGLRDYSVKSGGGFSNSYQNVIRSNGKNEPWLTYQRKKEKKRVEQVMGLKNTRSSWEESAEKFLEVDASVSGNMKSTSFENYRNRYGDHGAVLGVEEEGEIEGNDDPRWDKIEYRANKMMDSRPSFDKVDNWGNKKSWREDTESSVPKMSGEGVYGIGPVLAALSAGRRELYALYVQEGMDLSSNNRKKKDKKGFEKVLRIAEKMGLNRKDISKHDMNMVADNRPHQGLLLDASPLEMEGVKELDFVESGENQEKKKAPLWVALDEVTDPQNLGAIIRSAYYFGAKGVVLCAKNSAPLGGVVSKASAGSLELMELRSCKNMMQFLVNSSDNGWRVIGGSVSSKAVSIKEIKPNLPTILVLGNEGTGLRPLVEKSCTDLVKIPGHIHCVNEGISDVENDDFMSFLAVESLNVSVAAGVLLHHLIGRSFGDYQKEEITNDLS